MKYPCGGFEYHTGISGGGKRCDNLKCPDCYKDNHEPINQTIYCYCHVCARKVSLYLKKWVDEQSKMNESRSIMDGVGYE